MEGILPRLEKKLKKFYEIVGSKTKLKLFLKSKGICLVNGKEYETNLR